MQFSTKDKDYDQANDNCAQNFKGSWWYSVCHTSNLNGSYLNGPHSSYADGNNWEAFRGISYSLKRTEMKVKTKSWNFGSSNMPTREQLSKTFAKAIRCDQIPRVNRLCPICASNQIEDESHFLIYCNKYSILRNKFYKKIDHIIPTFKQLSSLQATGELTTSSNHYINQAGLAPFWKTSTQWSRKSNVCSSQSNTVNPKVPQSFGHWFSTGFSISCTDDLYAMK